MSEDLIQGSPEWLSIRCGRVTASRVADVVAKTKTGYGASRANYMAELICERLTGQPAEKFTNAAMAWGTETEPEARAVYEFLHGVEVREVGFIHHPTIQMAGASPDGFVGDHGMVEIKAPNTATHIETLLSQAVPQKYLVQMQWQMACCPGRQWVDFTSYDPRLPDEMRMFVKRVDRDADLIKQLEQEVASFLKELDEKIIRLKTSYGVQEAA